MKTNLATLIGILLIMGLAGFAFAADNANHTVTVTVNAINEIAITGGNITLTISAASAGADPNAVTSSACGLNWTTNEATKKITAASDQPTPSFTLKVLAQALTGGTAAAEATLSNTTDHDVVTGISTTTGNCTLRYTATATAAQGTGSVVHEVTYTITAG
jgi:hypothetical protein